MQEAKCQGMLRDIEELLAAAREGRTVPRSDAEQLVGRLAHTAQVAREGSAFLHPLYRIRAPLVKARSRDQQHGALVWRQRRVRQREIKIAGDTWRQRACREALCWWDRAIAGGISVPLAPRRGFPDVGEEGYAFICADAAREAGSGFGDFSVVREVGAEATMFLYMAEAWDQETLGLLRRDVLSMPACQRGSATELCRLSGRRRSTAGRSVAPVVFHRQCRHKVRDHDRKQQRAAVGSPRRCSSNTHQFKLWLCTCP